MRMIHGVADSVADDNKKHEKLPSMQRPLDDSELQ